MGAPTIPIRERPRGTRRDWYSRIPSNRSHMAGMKLGPRRKMRSYRTTSAWPVTNPAAPTPACRKVTIDKRNATPTKMVPDSRIRAATRPSAAASFCLLSTGNRNVENEGRDRGKGKQVEHALDKRGLSKWTHLKLLLFDEVIDMMTTN